MPLAVLIMVTEVRKTTTMNQNIDRKVIAAQLIRNMKLCSQVMNDLVIDALSIVHDEDSDLLKTKTGEFLGFLYLDIYRKHILEEFPEFSNSLEQ